MSKILVTGGTGYIGSHTVVALHEAGYEVLIVDDLSNSNRQILHQLHAITGKWHAFVEMDLQDGAAVAQLASLHPDITGIIHFAAYKAVGESVSAPLMYYKNNFYSLINLLDAFQGNMNLVFSSSCTVYGQPDHLPVTERAPVKKAESPYGNTKQVAEEILMDVTKADPRWKVVSLRYFNPVGAHASALIGELPNGVPQNLVPFITQSAIGKRAALKVFGHDYNTPDGSAIRDYIHVVDLAAAHVAAIQRLERGEVEAYDVFNIGTGRGSTVLEIIGAFEKATGQKLPYEIVGRREGDVEQIYGDVTKSNEVLGWQAVLGLEEMMKSAWNWEKYLHEHPFS